MPKPKAKTTFNSAIEPKQNPNQLRLVILEDGSEVARTTMKDLQGDLEWYRRNNPDKTYKHICTAQFEYGLRTAKNNTQKYN